MTFELLSIIEKKTSWLKNDYKCPDGVMVSCRSPQYKSLPLLLKMSYIKYLEEWPTNHKPTKLNKAKKPRKKN